jgi:hypothetical protein
MPGMDLVIFIDMKTCNLCLLNLDGSQFRIRKIKDKTYTQPICKECERKKDRERYVDEADARCERGKVRRGTVDKQPPKTKSQYYHETKHKPLNIITRSVRRRLKKYIIKFDITKNNKTFHYIGCSPSELKSHIESLFTEGMSWDNYGLFGWHIDHIIPLSSANTKEEMLKLNHHTNLQPLWWKDNLSKSKKLL